MKLGIPTLCRYDLLKELLASVEQGTLLPSGYIIVDNGGRLDESVVRAWLGRRGSEPALVEFISPGENIGVAAAWNLMIDRAAPEPLILSNDDIVFRRETFAELCAALETHDFVEGDGWALFGQRFELTQTVGYYDENFWPAYYEDVDYDLRLAKAGVTAYRPLSAPVHHVGWGTTRTVDSTWITEGRERNHAYFIAKWGGESKNPRWNGTPDIEHYDRPFNGYVLDNWTERGRTQPISMHWDVLNYVAKKIGAKRYLEIGVERGECLSHLDIAEKWGVDPDVVPDGVRACDVVIPKTSMEFFALAERLPGLTFDIVFIDGDHRAEVVYAEVLLAQKLLSPRGVICLHDVNPYTEAMQEVPYRPGLWTGDVWKAVARLRAEGRYHIGTVPFDYGTAILVPESPERPAPIQALPCPWERLMWKDLVRDRQGLIGLLDPIRWRASVDRMLSRAAETTSGDSASPV